MGSRTTRSFRRLILLGVLAAAGWWMYTTYIMSGSGNAYYSAIKEVSGSEAATFIKRINDQGSVVVVYIYSGDGCHSCDLILPDIQKLAKKYPKPRVVVLAIAIRTEKRALAVHLDRLFDTSLSFVPLMIPPYESGLLEVEMKKLNSGYKGGAPFVEVMNHAGYFVQIAPGPRMFNQLDRVVRKATR